MRWSETHGLFTPADDPKTNVWYLRDSKGIAEAKKWASVAPFYIDQESPVLDPQHADSAIFYSITNCQEGLRGVPFGRIPSMARDSATSPASMPRRAVT